MTTLKIIGSYIAISLLSVLIGFITYVGIMEISYKVGFIGESFTGTVVSYIKKRFKNRNEAAA